MTSATTLQTGPRFVASKAEGLKPNARSQYRVWPACSSSFTHQSQPSIRDGRGLFHLALSIWRSSQSVPSNLSLAHLASLSRTDRGLASLRWSGGIGGRPRLEGCFGWVVMSGRSAMALEACTRHIVGVRDVESEASVVKKLAARDAVNFELDTVAAVREFDWALVVDIDCFNAIHLEHMCRNSFGAANGFEGLGESVHVISPGFLDCTALSMCINVVQINAVRKSFVVTLKTLHFRSTNVSLH